MKEKLNTKDVSDRAAWSILNRFEPELLEKIGDAINKSQDQEEREIMANLIIGAAREAASPIVEEGE